MKLEAPFRPATILDAEVLAELMNYAGEGMPLYLWEKLASPGQDGWDVGKIRAARDTGSFSYRNAIVIEENGDLAGCLIGYEIPDCVEAIAADMPAMFRPLQELENLAPGTWYVNVLAVLPAHRNKGIGTRLLALADKLSISKNKRGMSLIISDGNTDARRLYESCGYSEVAVRPMVKEDWVNEGQNWVLLVKDF